MRQGSMRSDARVSGEYATKGLVGRRIKGPRRGARATDPRHSLPHRRALVAAASSVAANGRMRPCRQRVDPAREGAPLRVSHGAWRAARRRQTPRAHRSRRGAHLGAGGRVRREVECAPRKLRNGACAAPSVGDDRHRAVAEAGVLELRRPIEHQFTGTFARITCAPPPCGPTGADRPFLMPRIRQDFMWRVVRPARSRTPECELLFHFHMLQTLAKLLRVIFRVTMCVWS